MKKNQTIAQFLGITKFPFEIEQGRTIYSEDSDGYWQKREYDAKGNITRYEDSDGDWSKKEYDAKGNITRYEISNGFWEKREFDANRKIIYYENSRGHIVDKRPKQVELTLTEIATKLNIPLEQLRIKE